MQTFIVTCEGIERKVSYEDKKSAEVFADYIHHLEQKEYLSLDEELRKRYESKQENPLNILSLLAQKHPKNFLITYTIGDMLQEHGRYEESIAAFEHAFANADHATFKLKASLGIGLSWKMLGDKLTDLRSIEESPVCYYRAEQSLFHAEQYNYAATPTLAVIVEYTHASLNIVTARNQINIVATKPELKKEHPDFKKSISRFLTSAKIHKTLSMNVAEYYGVKNMEEEYAHMDVDIDNLDKELNIL